ncbi:PAS domain-containing sensor histidine kinase [Paraburkholderia terrae]|uniref:histidine kinase n=1 Tax=Paraburkholderia terrae TaxID=311230 RepID=A0ABN6JVD6_9BURK|nr:PAS domain-containing sensor histidine kinase [Paraburkholderia terrae]BCZ84928.1 sensor protein FixL [Paraburkholderia terrae]BDC44904.1 sensor protein FixL [Paraburkholderia terrae]
MSVRLNYYEVFKHANDSMLIHDGVTGAILEANEAACRLFGRTVKELRSMTIGELSAGDENYNLDTAINYIQSAARLGGLFNYEWHIRHSSGTVIPIEGNLKLIKGTATPMVLAISRDISERRLAEARLRERGRYFEELSRNSSDGVALINETGVIQYVGESLRGILGYRARSVIGRSIFDFLDASDSKKAVSILAKVRRAKLTGGTFEYKILHRDGTLRNHEAIFKNLLSDPLFNAILVNFRDVTARVQQEETAREYERQINHYARLSIAGETAAALAHEVNQPLCAAVNFFAGCRRRLEAGGGVSEINEALDLAQKELERAGRIVHSIRNFTANRATSRRVHSVRAIIEGIACFIEIRAAQDSVMPFIDIVDDALIECDDVLIQQVITNLAVNGIEAMADVPEQNRRLLVTARVEGKEVTISVEDSGKGVTSDPLNRRSGDFFTTKEQGVGIGLLLCHSIIESHGGRLTSKSIGAAGTRFSFALPIIA